MNLTNLMSSTPSSRRQPPGTTRSWDRSLRCLRHHRAGRPGPLWASAISSDRGWATATATSLTSVASPPLNCARRHRLQQLRACLAARPRRRGSGTRPWSCTCSFNRRRPLPSSRRPLIGCASTALARPRWSAAPFTASWRAPRVRGSTSHASSRRQRRAARRWRWCARTTPSAPAPSATTCASPSSPTSRDHRTRAACASLLRGPWCCGPPAAHRVAGKAQRCRGRRYSRGRPAASHRGWSVRPGARLSTNQAVGRG
mmetsp:Transcript_10732/g.25246  ORF Transcript_10732/g.25246 Transcript_10732/m.25246 type:complete len:258 (+) Transcript_10732:553-1326(+)